MRWGRGERDNLKLQSAKRRAQTKNLKIAIENRHRDIKIDRVRTRRTVRKVLKSMGLSSGELSILFMDDEGIRELNRDYGKKNMPTDVLSFPMREGEFGDINPSLLGDVAVSLDTAKRQAEERGETLEEELDFLLVHGILHLLGYDHEKSPSEAKIMRGEEKEILKRLKEGTVP
jgi:probable rRNA maturation factor